MTDVPHELSVTRLIKASPETVWKVYTERGSEWFCPKPWTTPVVETGCAGRNGGVSHA